MTPFSGRWTQLIPSPNELKQSRETWEDYTTKYGTAVTYFVVPVGHLSFADGPAIVRVVCVTAGALVLDGSIPVEIVTNGHVVVKGKGLDQWIELEDSAWSIQSL